MLVMTGMVFIRAVIVINHAVQPVQRVQKVDLIVHRVSSMPILYITFNIHKSPITVNVSRI